MAQPRHEPIEQPSEALFDRYTLPKVALAIILLASLLGTALTLGLSGFGSLLTVLAKWGYLVTLGVLVGGLGWKHGFVRPQDLDEGTESYCGRMYDRFGSILLFATGVLALTGVGVLARYWLAVPGTVVPATVTALFTALVFALGASLVGSSSIDEQFRSPRGLAAFGLAVAVLSATAVAEVALSRGTAGEAAVRTLHLLAFAFWIGGAVWNIFVAVPTGQESPTVPVVRAAGQQLERFRWAVRLIFPTILLTGLYQAYALFGWNLQVYLQSVFGLAIVGKLGLVATLFVIFKLCPMWRACSPIEGVCDLEELGGSQEVSDDD
ncbi:hypothetical protein [Halovenus sp. HT40]|uniref:hypothetical protein n=1 Tax=Halovenus sp. HT40 TaxID=3126691 RepID=UPI00300EDB17